MSHQDAPAGLADLVAAVAGRQPVDDRERTGIASLLQEVARLPRPFDQDADPTHVTASAIVVGPRGVVLHLHRRLGLWLQPGGHIERGETPAAAAHREAREETGLAVDHPRGGPRLVHVDVHPGPRGHTHLDVRYLLMAGHADPAPARGESQQVRWFDWEEAVAMADAGLVGALRDLRPRH